MRRENQLQISEFIKEPSSLKLLILAGTNIRPVQLSTVSKCVSLIKLDLSSNLLVEVPLRFTIFPHLKVLYLHDNKLTSINILRTNIEYISLFDNPVHGYRSQLIANNSQLKGIDHNIVSRIERQHPNTSLHPYCSIRWPIVQVFRPLQKETDYLNLLKAQIFVIDKLYEGSVATESVYTYLRTWFTWLSFHAHPHPANTFALPIVIKVAKHWMQYTRKRRKLRFYLRSIGQQHLLNNKVEERKRKRSNKVQQCITNFINHIRSMISARSILRKNLSAYRAFIPAYKECIATIKQQGSKIYFKESQWENREKIFLFLKKLLFKKQQYDYCDNFKSIIRETAQKHKIIRDQNKQTSNQWLRTMVRNIKGMIIVEKGVDRRNVLYTKKGHKLIRVKGSKAGKSREDKLMNCDEKYKRLDEKYKRLDERYDTLVCYEVLNQQIYALLMRVIWQFNAGNSSVIMSTQAAYFQTQVIIQSNKKESIFVGSEFYIVRMRSAVIIQRFWRRMKNRINIFSVIRKQRGQKLINSWLRRLVFEHRQQLNKWTNQLIENQYYMQLDIYMQLPRPKDYLRYALTDQGVKESLKGLIYDLLHRRTETDIVSHPSGRRWVRLRFQTPAAANRVCRLLSILTYRYYCNGTYIRLFTFSQTQQIQPLQMYQHKIKRIFKIQVEVKRQNSLAKIEIGNPNPLFIWMEGEENKFQSSQNVPISIFVYNKHQRPLKVNCNFMWTMPISIYPEGKNRMLRNPRESRINSEARHSIAESQVPNFRKKKVSGRNQSLLKHRKKINSNLELGLLSQTLNISRK